MSVLKYKDKDGNWQTLGGVMAKQINVVQTTGTSIDDVMSQNAVSELLNDKSDTGHTHVASDITDLGTMAKENKASYSSATEVSNALSNKANTATTITGYGITDAKIENGTITLGNNTITPLTSVTIPVTSVTTSSTNGSVSVNGSDVSVYTHPTTAGNKHIPSGGSSGQFLGYDSAGTAKWVDNPNTNRSIKVDGTNFLTDTSTALNLSGGTNVSLTTGSTGLVTISATDTNTTYTAGSFITITGSTNAINVSTGTSNSTVARGDHNHDSVYTKITDSEAMEQTLAAAITNIDSRAADKEELKALVNDYQDFKLMYENRRERKRFTNRDDFFANLKRAAADQNLERYGLKVGDYLNYNGHDYVIAGLNTMRGSYSPYRLTTDHVGLIVIPHTTQAWNISGNTYQSTYTYATSGGTWTAGAGAGYANSDLHHYMTETLLPMVKTDLDSYASGILKHNKLYSNAVNTNGYNRYGSAGGCSSSWAWYENQEICALSEVQVYGSIVWSSSGYDTGEACRQLDVFRVYNMNEIFGWEYPWLRDVASASLACDVGGNGGALYDTASAAICVAALILFA